MADLNPDSLNKLRVIDLREHLSSRGLPTSGLKADLVKRLREAILNPQLESEDNSEILARGEERMDVDEKSVQDESTDEGDHIESAEMEEGNSTEEEEAKFKAEEGARLQAEEEARLQAEEEARLQAEEEARLQAEEEARLQAEEEARLQAEEEARLQAEEEARLQAEEEARRRVEEETRLQAEKEARRRAEEEARLQAEEKARRRAEEEARLQAEEKARRKSEEEARRRAEEEARLQAEEKARRKSGEEARRRAEEEARLQAEEEARRRAEEEAKLQAEEKARLKAEEEKAMLRAMEKARIRCEKMRHIALAEEAKLKYHEEARLQAVEERKQKAEEKVKAEEERKRMYEEKKKVLEEERKRVAEEKRIAEEERKRVAEEKRIAEEERKRVAEEKRIAEEEMRIEQERWLVEEQMRRAQEEHKMRMKAEEQKRLLEEERERTEKQKRLEQQKKLEEEQQKKFEEEQQKKFEEEQQKKFEVQQKKFEEEQKRLLLEEQQKKAAEEQRRLQEEERLKRAEEQKQFLADEEQKMSEEEIQLPQAIEKVLALKSERAQLLGIDPDAVVQPVTTGDDKSSSQKSAAVTLVSVDEDEGYGDDDDAVTKTKESKSRRRKKKKKKRSSRVQEKAIRSPEKPTETTSDVDVEYVQEVIDVSDPLYSQFMKIFDRFKLTDGEKEKEETPMDVVKDSAKEESLNPMALRKKPVDLDDDDDDEKDDDDKIEEEKPKLSKRKLKKLSRMTVAELKQKVNRPELVEMHDVTAKDPVLLLHLKASRNTVPVPRHWCFKRKYLQGKRGIEKPAFELPDFIKKTGIMEMRQALQEKEDQKTMKAKMRERVRPKLGKIDIDYQKLHDAFFKWQTKPKMTIHGDLYYEGKEFETRLKEKKPGDLSEDLRTALGMPTGPNAHKCPPPWLIAMQRYGPPPSYPNLKIPGLNAPIPEDCSFGYHAGGWGKPPVDETGRPLYGDVFGTQIAENQPNIQEEEIDHTLWGELESESSEEEEDEDEEDEDEEEEKAEDESGLVTPAEGLITPSGFSSIPAGMETPDMIELRKRKIESEIEGGETPALYTILPEKKGERVGAAMMGSTHIYDLAAAIPAGKLRMPGTSSVPPQGIEVALDPSELEMDSAAMAARYEQTMREQQSQLEKEDLSDMVAEHAARQKNKRKKQQLTSAKPPKKYKEFKF